MKGVLVRRKKPFLLYHWSMEDRRKGILKHGLVIGSPHMVHTPGWSAKYLCFADSPSLAWALSGNFAKINGTWDLWMCWSNSLDGVYVRGDHVGLEAAEYRTFTDVPASALWLVGQREATFRKSRK